MYMETSLRLMVQLPLKLIEKVTMTMKMVPQVAQRLDGFHVLIDFHNSKFESSNVSLW